MRDKRILFVPFGAVALVMVLAASAFACTVFRGTFTVQGNASPTKVTATGTGTGMSSTISDGIAKATDVGGSVKLWTGADPYGRTLPANKYFVRYYNGAGFKDHYHWQVDCMVGGPGVDLGTVDVNSRGRIDKQPAQFALPVSTPNSAPEESAVCISDRGGAFGNQVPLTII
jgi:hypothetical protein